MRPLRMASFSVTTPRKLSSQSMKTCSMGSRRTPFFSLKMTSGRPTLSSKPSRRMVSMRMAIWNSPRPLTTKLSFSSLSSTRMATLDRISFISRSRMRLDCTSLPSRPAKGEELMANFMATVGSSTVMRGRALGLFLVQMVSPMCTSSMPESTMMSPAMAPSTSRKTGPS